MKESKYMLDNFLFYRNKKGKVEQKGYLQNG